MSGGKRTGGRASARLERRANKVDHYSLLLQVVQVFPIITTAAMLAVPNVLAARLLCGAGLAVLTVFVVFKDRRDGRAGVQPAPEAAPRPQPAAGQPPRVPVPAGLAKTAVAEIALAAKAGASAPAFAGASELTVEDRLLGRISISIQVSTSSAAASATATAVAAPEVSARSATPPPPAPSAPIRRAGRRCQSADRVPVASLDIAALDLDDL